MSSLHVNIYLIYRQRHRHVNVRKNIAKKVNTLERKKEKGNKSVHTGKELKIIEIK